MRMSRLAFAAVAAAMLAGCATSNLKPGASRQDVIAGMGRPTAVVALPGGGERLQYSGQPAGQYAWMADLDAAGRLVSLRQVLNAADFQRIEIDRWTRGDVEREFGPPASIDRVASWNGPILTYRWNEGPMMDRFYSVYLDGRGVVRRAHPSIELLPPQGDRD
jgi:hypothetical protein